MEKTIRITAKDLKKWLETVNDDAEIRVDNYSSSSSHHVKEFIIATEYGENGSSKEKELLVSKVEKIV